MNKNNKLKKVVKRVLGYNVRLSLTSGYAVYAHKKLIKDNFKTVENAADYINNL